MAGWPQQAALTGQNHIKIILYPCNHKSFEMCMFANQECAHLGCGQSEVGLQAAGALGQCQRCGFPQVGVAYLDIY